jgi:O-antigen/teichoic acid export membrane protein
MSRETVIAIGAKFVLAATGFLGVVIFSRVLGVSGVGKYYALLAGAKLATQVPSAVSGAIKKRVSEFDTNVAGYFGLGIVFHTLFALLLGVTLLVAHPYLRSYIGPRVFGLGLVIVVASLSMFSLVNRIYGGIGNPGASFWTDTVRSVLTLGAQVALLLLGWNVLGLLFGLSLGTILTAIGVYALIRIRPSRPSQDVMRRTYEFARWNIPNALLENTYSRLDVLLLYAIVGSTAVGLYEPALRLTMPATFLAASIGDTLLVKSSGLNSLDRNVLSDLRNSVSYVSLISIPLFFGALALSESLMRIVYGPDFVAGAQALVGLAAFQLFNSFKNPFSSVIDGIDRPKINFRVKLGIVLIHAPLAILLGLEYGLMGVIAATIISEAIRVILYLFTAYSLFGEVPVTWPVAKQFVSGLIMFGVVSLVNRRIPATDWVGLLLIVTFGAVIYFLTLTAVSPHFRQTGEAAFRNVVPNKFRQ